jgi:hypothetical protein
MKEHFSYFFTNNFIFNFFSDNQIIPQLKYFLQCLLNAQRTSACLQGRVF